MDDDSRAVIHPNESDLQGGSDAYARAGVDIAAGNEAVARYKEFSSWRHPLAIGGIGGFAGLFRVPGDERRALVASTDGVGTKVLIAAELRRFDSVGADLVNHCVNDIVVTNATPLFFLDYLAVGKLEPGVAAELVGSVERACRAHEMALLGGETAEMPGVYSAEHFDLAGTIVGIVELDRVPDPARVVPTDAIVGFPSVGLHTNGYSLARALLPADEWNRTLSDGTTIADALMAPHPSYYREVRAVEAVSPIKAMAHITGRGVAKNVPRSLQPGFTAGGKERGTSIPPIMQE